MLKLTSKLRNMGFFALRMVFIKNFNNLRNLLKRRGGPEGGQGGHDPP